jgi:hypothetical protein
MSKRLRFLAGVVLVSLALVDCRPAHKSGNSDMDEPSGRGLSGLRLTSECDAIIQKFHTRLTQGNSACQSDKDCGCYNPVDPTAGCGGVTDRATATQLGQIESEFHANHCDWRIQCGPWRCQPRCQAGRCSP